MPAFTDIVVLFFLIRGFWNGWTKGLFRSLIWPISFAFCTTIGIIYFDLTQNLIITFAIIFGGTAAVSIIVTIMHLIGRATVEKDYRDFTLWMSRCLGSVASFLWQGAFTLLLMVFLTVLPTSLGTIEKVQADIYKSRSYAFADYYIVQSIPRLRNIIVTLSVLKNPHELQDMVSTEEFQQFFLDEKILQLMSDERLMDLLKKKELVKFVADPLVKGIIRDQELMVKFTELTRRIYSEKTKNLHVEKREEQ